MIPWFFSQSHLRAFPGLSTRKQNKEKEQIFGTFNAQRQIMDERISLAKGSAKKVSRFSKKAKLKDKATEAMRNFTSDIIATQPILNSYVKTSLELQMLEVMSLEGFEFPDMLMDMREDIDFGLFSVNSIDDLGGILENEDDPFTELGIELG